MLVELLIILPLCVNRMLSPCCLSVAVLLMADYLVSGAGLPGKLKAEKLEFHWGLNRRFPGSEHSLDGRKYPIEVRKIRTKIKCNFT